MASIWLAYDDSILLLEVFVLSPIARESNDEHLVEELLVLLTRLAAGLLRVLAGDRLESLISLPGRTEC